jgi:hypothetical protein
MRVTFARTGRSEEWDSSFPNILEFAEAKGIYPAYSCRAGICSTCIQTLTGKVTYVSDPLDEPPDGQALICCSVPNGDITLEL